MSNVRDALPKSVIYSTPIGVAVFPKLHEPDTKFKKEGEYKTGLRLTSEEAAPLLAKLNEMADAAYEAAKGWIEKQIEEASNGKEKGKFKTMLKELERADLPVKPTYDDDGDETGDVEFNFKMRASGKRANGKTYTQSPIVVDSKKKKMNPEIWGGSKIIVNFAMAPFFTPAVGAGVSLKLRGVQVLELRKGGANPDDMFSEQEGYTATEESDGNEASEPQGDSAAAADSDDL